DAVQSPEAERLCAPAPARRRGGGVRRAYARQIVPALALIAGAAAAEPPLNAPAYMLRPSDPRAAPQQPCGGPAPPIPGLTLRSAYRRTTAEARAKSDTVDPAALKQYQAQVAGLHQYQFELAKRVDLYVRGGAPAMAACVLEWQRAWAAGNAMLADM